MTTTGYGDIVAKTNEGRIVVMISCIVGVFLISMMIVAITNIFALNNYTSLKAFIILEKVDDISLRQDLATKVVGNFMALTKKTKSLKSSIQNEQTIANDLRRSVNKFKNKRFQPGNMPTSNNFNSYNDCFNSMDRKQRSILKQRTFIREKVIKLKNSVESLLGRISKLKKDGIIR
jgi:potassium intermediate/small conductance calcium-activated channel subfamily N protein 2